jgi:hypothetical protein
VVFDIKIMVFKRLAGLAGIILLAMPGCSGTQPTSLERTSNQHLPVPTQTQTENTGNQPLPKPSQKQTEDVRYPIKEIEDGKRVYAFPVQRGISSGSYRILIEDQESGTCMKVGRAVFDEALKEGSLRLVEIVPGDEEWEGDYEGPETPGYTP